MISKAITPIRVVFCILTMLVVYSTDSLYCVLDIWITLVVELILFLSFQFCRWKAMMLRDTLVFFFFFSFFIVCLKKKIFINIIPPGFAIALWRHVPIQVKDGDPVFSSGGKSDSLTSPTTTLSISPQGLSVQGSQEGSPTSPGDREQIVKPLLVLPFKFGGECLAHS